MEVSIRGCLRGFIADVTVLQRFQQDEQESAEMSYIVPNNSKICIYDTTFYVGDEVIKPRVEEKKDAEEIYLEAKSENLAALLASNIGNGLIEFTLGNIGRGVSVCVEVKCCFIGSRSGVSGMLFKFPLDVCTQSGSTQCITNDLRGSFSFELDFSSRKRDIFDVSSNSASGRYDKDTCKFCLSSAEGLSAVVVTVNFGASLKDEFFVGGPFMGVSVFGREFKGFSSEQNNEFIFVVDCSGSMRGGRIHKAGECLDLFLRSLPVGSYFNIYRFGSRFNKLFDESVVYDDDTFGKAIALANNLEADLGGTEIYPVLQDIFTTKQKGIGTRQVFILTDGEVSDTDLVLSCAKEHRDLNRLFTLGIGKGADAGLVEGLANASGGRCDFVIDSDDDFSDKVIPQLEASLSCVISNVSIHIEGHEDVEFCESPLYPISVDGDTHVILKSNKAFSGDETVLVSGCYGDEHVDIAVSASESFPKGDSSVGRVLEVLFNYNVLQGLIRRLNGAMSNESLKEQIIMLSKSSGLLSPLTSFVGCSNKRYHRRPVYDALESDLLTSVVHCRTSDRGAPFDDLDIDDLLEELTASRTSAEEIGDCLCADNEPGVLRAAAPPPMACAAPPIVDAAPPKKEQAPAKQEFTFRSVTVLQSIRGYWDDISTILSAIGKQGIDVPSGLSSASGICEDDKSRAFNTVVALAVLRHQFISSQSSWKMIEKKALSWLSSVSRDVNWESLIVEVSSKL